MAYRSQQRIPASIKILHLSHHLLLHPNPSDHPASRQPATRQGSSYFRPLSTSIRHHSFQSERSSTYGACGTPKTHSRFARLFQNLPMSVSYRLPVPIHNSFYLYLEKDRGQRSISFSGHFQRPLQPLSYSHISLSSNCAENLRNRIRSSLITSISPDQRD